MGATGSIIGLALDELTVRHQREVTTSEGRLEMMKFSLPSLINND